MKKNYINLIVIALLVFSIQAVAQSKKKKLKKEKDNSMLMSKDTTKTAKSDKIIKEEGTPVKTETTTNTPVKTDEAVKDTKTETTVITETNTAAVNEIIKNSEPIITPTTNGSINWSEQYVEAKGESVIDNEKFKNPAQARAMATRGAVVVAQRNLLEIVKGVQVTSETTVQDMVATSDFIYTRLDGMIKGAQQVGEAVEKNGVIEVRMRVPLYDKNGLAPVIFDNIPAQKNINQVSENTGEGKTMARAANNSSATESTSTEAGSGKAGSGNLTETQAETLEQFAFNFKGKKIDPSMFPVVVDEKNNLLLDLTKLYDAKNGKFPKMVKATDDLIKSTGYSKNIKVLDVLSTNKGKIVIDNKSVKKVNWQKIGQTAAKIGKLLLLLI